MVASLSSALLALVGAAQIDSQTLCFEPGTDILTPDAYETARVVGRQATQEPTWSRHVRLGSGGRPRRFEEAQLELMRAGVGVGRIQEVEGAADEDCLPVTVVVGDKPVVDLWHFWGPYFEPGDANVTDGWARRMRYIVVGYRPGETKFCIDGHSDTAGDAAVNLRLSRRRAEAVAGELIRQGVREDDTVVRAYGETRLARHTADGVSEPLNRRVFVEPRPACRAAH